MKDTNEAQNWICGIHHMPLPSCEGCTRDQQRMDEITIRIVTAIVCFVLGYLAGIFR